MPSDHFVFGNNLVQVAWGLFPNEASSDIALVRGTVEPKVLYNAFSFFDLYDYNFSMYMGIAMLVFSQFWGLTVPIAILIEIIILGVDFWYILEAI